MQAILPCCRLLLLSLVLGLGRCGGPVQAQALRSGLKRHAYDFLGQYFRHFANPPGQTYRLDRQLLPVVSPYASNFDLRAALSADYLTKNQFVTAIEVDSLLAEADFAWMRAQVAAWQTRRRWSARRLWARRVRLVGPARRGQGPRLFPAFTTYQVFPPLFSRSGQLVLFYVESYGGVECAGGQLNLLRRQPNGTWTLVLGVPIFVS